ncbi:hypothetical protein HDU80_005336 [Chytriomyces hyalinus]|nr:hypothetical protein HDU80_005336 [Chytriomyces hyalinus]
MNQALSDATQSVRSKTIAPSTSNIQPVNQPQVTLMTDTLLFAAVQGSFVTASVLTTGQELWRFSFDDKHTPNRKPISLVTDPIRNTLIISTGAQIICLSATDGTVIWNKAVSGISASGISVLAAGYDPAQYKASVATNSPAKLPPYKENALHSDPAVFMANKDAVMALNIDTGAVIWKRFFPVEMPRMKPFLLVQDGILIAAAFGRVRAFNAFTGAEVWNTSTITLQITTALQFYSVQADEGTILATMRSGNRAENIPYHHFGMATTPLSENIIYAANGYITSIAKSVGLRAVSSSNKAASDIPFKGAGYTSIGILPVGNKQSVLAIAGNTLRNYNLKSGSLLWEHTEESIDTADNENATILIGSGVPPPLFPSPELDSSNAFSSADARFSDLFYFSMQGHIRAINMKTGDELWAAKTSFGRSMVPASIFLEDGKVFLAGSKTVACFDALTGQMIWTKASIHGRYAAPGSLMSGNGETNRSSTYEAFTMPG